MITRRRVGIAGAVAATVALGGAVPVWRERPAEVEPAVRARIVPLVERHLEANATPGERTFCAVHLLDARRRAKTLIAAVHAHCERLRAADGTLQVVAVHDGALRVSLRSTGGAWRVAGVAKPLPPAVDTLLTGPASADPHAAPPAPSPTLHDRARTVFGLPPGAPVAPS
ncbi:hypothetical protein [Actinomadura flavalba]|uniref:hypothetical protein n=1 Tax=Actinomadura flavalba TaxID=1120938 RepID=UPI000376384D|nr:hypothetical protein [Actinomadura flavalba]